MKSLKKVIYLITALMCGIMFGLFALTACGEEEEPPYEPPKNCDVVLEQKGYDWGEKYSAFIEVCDSYSEICEKLKNHGLESWNNDKVREYADEHVEDKSFVVCFYGESGDGGQQRLREIEVNGGKLTMYIWYERRGDVSCVIINRLFIAGVDKSFVANVTECEYEFV